jgi:hypothetical protein
MVGLDNSENKRYYIIQGEKNLGECNIRADVIIQKNWVVEGFDYRMVIVYRCGCRMHAGEIALMEENNWPDEISQENDFAFELFCSCGAKLYEGDSAHAVQDKLGWLYVVM